MRRRPLNQAVPKLKPSMTRLLILVISFCTAASVTLQPHVIQAEEQPPRRVLLLFDSLAIGTAREGNVEAMLRLLAVKGLQAKLQRVDEYREGQLAEYRGLVFMANNPKPDGSNARHLYAEDLLRYGLPYLHAGYDLPSAFAERLRLRTALSEAEQAQVTIGPLEGAPLGEAERMPYISDSQGTPYGSVAWPSSGKQAPFAVLEQGIAYAPVFVAGAASELAMAYMLKDWLGDSRTGSAHLLLKEIYPFTDLALLQATADALYDAGLPFIYSVRPVFANTDFPAMRRYLEVLKYAQSRNGTIFAEAPVVSGAAGIQTSPIKEKMAGFLNLLAESSIVPLGVGADAGLYLRNEGQFAEEGMAFFRSSALYPDSDAFYLEQAELNTTFPESMLCVRWDELEPYWKDRSSATLPVDVAMYADFFTDAAGMESALRRWKSDWIVFADFKKGRHLTRTEAYSLESSQGTLAINGSPIGLNDAVRAVSADYAYREEERKSLERLFTVQNYVYVTVICFSLIVFGVFLLIGVRLYRRKFMK
ncbi:hypothetical protein [Paenibacillus soyae]|uniref:DUF2334 domain-containing protein n=1 Tax=Paenibacillus soyae TaxID=2969249 RepID=A0A9X2SDF1_9BACL|nr:hypothetical protein [Paenibacillus soyae]MCR2807818.1 hypothetical protein [Paenibacillus soyae]